MAIKKRFLYCLSALLLAVFPAVYADEIPDRAGGGDHGTLGGERGGSRLKEGDSTLEGALRQGGFIRDAGEAPPAEPTTHTEDLAGGGTRTTTTQPDGSRTITTTGRNAEPTDQTIIFDKDGHVTQQTGRHSDGKTDTMTYNPETGVRQSTSTDPNTGITVNMTSQDNGGSTTTITNPGQPTVTIQQDAQGNRTETTPKPDGGKTVIETPPGGPSTETQYGVDGKPDSSRTIHRTPGGTFTHRVDTTYDDNGNPVKTEVSVRGDYGVERVIEETEYWPGTKTPKRTIRRNRGGENTEVIYYDRNGNVERRSVKPGHTASEENPYLITPRLNHLRAPSDPEPLEPQSKVDQEDAFGQYDDMRTAGRRTFGRRPDGRNFTENNETQHPQHDGY